jgi:hypothetical protein
MTEAELLGKLNSLIRLDNDALASYNKAIDKMSDLVIKTEIIKFRDDHKRHVETLSRLVTKYGGVPAKGEKDIRGMFLSTATSVENLAGLQGSLMAMQTGEKVTNKDYAEAVTLDVPQDVQIVLKANYDDEKRHLRFIDQAIADKVWERR